MNIKKECSFGILIDHLYMYFDILEINSGPLLRYLLVQLFILIIRKLCLGMSTGGKSLKKNSFPSFLDTDKLHRSNWFTQKASKAIIYGAERSIDRVFEMDQELKDERLKERNKTKPIIIFTVITPKRSLHMKLIIL